MKIIENNISQYQLVIINNKLTRMYFLKINDESTKPIISHLTNRYPCLKKVEDRMKIRFEALHLFAAGISRNNDLGKLRWRIKENLEKGITDHESILFTGYCTPGPPRYYIYHKHKMSDFTIIRWVADFYGKTIDELAADAMYMYNPKIDHYKSITDKILLDNFLHIFKCDLLIGLGYVFYHFWMATIIHYLSGEDCCESCQHQLGKAMVQYIRNDMPYNYETFLDNSNLRELIEIMNTELKANYPEVYYKDFYKDRLKIIYDVYHDNIVYMDSFNEKSLKKYVKKNINLDICFTEDNSSFRCKKKNLFGHMYHIMVICGKMDGIDESDNAIPKAIQPNIKNFNNLSLELDI